MSFFVVVVNFDKICLCLEIYCQAWGLRKVRAAVVEWKGGKGKGGKTAVFEEQVVHNSQFKSIRFSNTVMALLVFFQLLAGSFSWYQYSPNADTHSACSWKLYKCWYPFSLFPEVFHGTSILQMLVPIQLVPGNSTNAGTHSACSWKFFMVPVFYKK